VARALSEKRELVTTASTGNAAAALSGLAASVSLPVVIFVPASAPVAKVTQLLVYGAHVFLVDGTYDDAFDLCLQASKRYAWYCRNTGYNPYTVEGKKTVSYEICEQLAGYPGKFSAPDVVIVSVGDGNIIGGVYKGLKDLLALGWIDKLPRLIGVQAEGSSALMKAWKSNLDPLSMSPMSADTIADSISASLPRDRIRAMNAVRDTNGVFLSVTDEEILKAIPALARSSGVFSEPAAAAAFAGFLKGVDSGVFSKNDELVIISTGNGLKDINTAQKAVAQAHNIKPSMADVENVVNGIFHR
jgi:threonine synthase